MSWEYGLILAFSTVALVLSLTALTRNPAETVRRMAQEALERSTLTQTSNEAFKADCTAILGSVQDERERTEKARARARSAQQRAEAVQPNNRPQTRDEQLAGLRRQAGIL